MKKYLITFFSLCSLLLLPSISFADLCVAGFGQGNGTYIEQGVSNSKIYWRMGSLYQVAWTTDLSGSWTISEQEIPVNIVSSDIYYYAGDEVSLPWQVATWSVNVGASPAGTVVQGACSSSSGISSSTNATSTVNQIQQNLFFGFVLFFIAMSFIMPFIF